MPDPSNSSFIPKRGPASRVKRSDRSKQVYVFTLFSYILMFATLLAAGGMFLYEQYLNKQLNDEIAALNSEIASFSKANMQKVLDFDQRLAQASGRLDASVSLVSVFQALEAATIDTVMLNSMTMERIEDEKYLLSAVMHTDSFDSTIFQRGVIERNQTISAITISEIEAAAQGNESGNNNTSNDNERPKLAFTAELEVPVSSIPFQPAAAAQSAPFMIDTSSDSLEVGELQTNDEVETEEIEGNEPTL